MAGGFEPISKPIFSDGVPSPFEFQLLPEDWDHFRKLILYQQPLLYTAIITVMCQWVIIRSTQVCNLASLSPKLLSQFIYISL